MQRTSTFTTATYTTIMTEDIIMLKNPYANKKSATEISALHIFIALKVPAVLRAPFSQFSKFSRASQVASAAFFSGAVKEPVCSEQAEAVIYSAFLVAGFTKAIDFVNMTDSFLFAFALVDFA